MQPNYRLGSLGFLPVDSSARGNYAISDVIALLQWLQTNGPSFGGDPSRVTLFGQSAGAQLVTALLSAPRAAGLFHRAIVQSGRPSDKQNELSTSEAARGAADAVIQALGCGPAADKLACLRALPVQDFVRKSPSFSRPVVDGTYLTTPRLDVTRQMGGIVARVPVVG
jgi:carboxylesterase type B